MGVFRTMFEGRRKLFWTLAGGIFVADQVTKLLLWQQPGGARPDIVLVPHVLRIISHGGNVRGALGLGPSGPLFYIIAAIAGLAAVAIFFLSTDSRKTLAHIALGMLAGGALGNLLDRIVLGVVRDFVDLHWGESLHWHTFNVADAMLCVAVGLLVVATCLTGSSDQTRAPRQR